MMLSGGTIEEREAGIEFLPDEVLFDILVRLPADFLHHKARLVCHRWRHIILSNVFINTHLQRSTYGLVLSSRPHSIYVTATQGGRIETSGLSYLRRRSQVIASGNGLALELHNVYGLHVVNPVTKQSLRLPSVSRNHGSVFYYHCGIAYSAASMEYKVTLPYMTIVDKGSVQYGLDIVTVGVDKSWRRVVIPSSEHVFCSVQPLSTEGFLHWGCWGYCLTLNVETEIITMTKPPNLSDQWFSPYWYYDLSTGRNLTRLVGCGEFSWEVWEMSPSVESGDQWRKLLPNIDLEPQKQQFAFGDEECLLFPLGWVKYPEVLAFCIPGDGKPCIFYNLQTREITDLPPNKSFYPAFVHRNSLAWLSQDV